MQSNSSSPSWPITGSIITNDRSATGKAIILLVKKQASGGAANHPAEA